MDCCVAQLLGVARTLDCHDVFRVLISPGDFAGIPNLDALKAEVSRRLRT